MKQIDDALLVPNAALRFAPPATRRRAVGRTAARADPGPRSVAPAATTTATPRAREERVFVLDDGETEGARDRDRRERRNLERGHERRSSSPERSSSSTRSCRSHDRRGAVRAAAADRVPRRHAHLRRGPGRDRARSRGIDLRIERGEFVAVMGPSGSGKSTCMNLLGCLDTPTAGSYRFAGVEVGALSRDQRARLRREYIGFVFQGFNLLGRTHRARERRAAAGLPRRAGARSAASCALRALAVGGAHGLGESHARASSPAASSSASRSRARSSPSRCCCSPTSRPATSTPSAAARSWSCSRG